MNVLRNAITIIILSVILLTGLPGLASARMHHLHRDRRSPHERVSYELTSRGSYLRGGIERVNLSRAAYPEHEVRAMWVVRDSLASPEKIANVVATAKKYGFNTLFVQVRGRGDALYNSTLEPRSSELDGQPASFDPLATVIADAHADGIQVHAWLNTFYVWSSPTMPSSPLHVVNSHPEWLVKDASGNAPLTPNHATEGAFLSPANPNARQFIHDVFMEVVNNYDIDGIHFDYVRYPSEYYDYSPAALDGFTAFMNQKIPGCSERISTSTDPLAYVHAYPELWASWRRDQVTTLVRSISQDVKSAKPWVVVSAAVFANAEDAYDARGQDWKDWLKEGIIDVVVPMAYNNSSELVGSQLKDAETTAHEYGRFCYAGLGSWHITAESTSEKIKIARQLGVQGFVLFSYGGVTNYGSSLDYLNKLEATSFQRPAAIPNLTWLTPRNAPITDVTPPSGG